MYKKIVIFCVLHVPYALCSPQITLSQTNALAIGMRIWRNECNGTISGLTSWNAGEDFASLGIGHFIWFPEKCSSPYTQTFPALLDYFKKQNVALPTWLATAKACPWNSRVEFIKASASSPMQELRSLLANTIELQVNFIVQRLENTLPHLMHATPYHKRTALKKKFYRIANAPHGLYALIDYLNFKGEGTNKKERYAGKGWGLLQVLEQMNTSISDPLVAFADTASFLLTQRVQNAPHNKDEKRFLSGWLNRIKTYTVY